MEFVFLQCIGLCLHGLLPALDCLVLPTWLFTKMLDEKEKQEMQNILIELRLLCSGFYLHRRNLETQRYQMRDLEQSYLMTILKSKICRPELIMNIINNTLLKRKSQLLCYFTQTFYSIFWPFPRLSHHPSLFASFYHLSALRNSRLGNNSYGNMSLLLTTSQVFPKRNIL